MSTAIVVGGGIAGLLAARLLVRQHDRVVLVERDRACGGLLGSITDEAGLAFDLGAHVLSETGVPEIDGLLYGGLEEPHWRAFHVLRAGNWFGGRMYPHSPFPDARVLDAETLRQGLDELRHAATHRSLPPPRHLGEAMQQRFGATLATTVVAPVVRKQLGTGLEELHPDTPFAIRRIVCADAEESRRLKQEPCLSEPLAFASYEEGVGSIRHYYPRHGGIGQWADSFAAGLRRDGVEIACGITVTSLTHAAGRVSTVCLSDGRNLDCDQLAWTLPAALLLRAANIPFEGRPPPIRSVGLFHLVFDKPFLDSNYHITCYDEDLHSFRITLYPNLRGEPRLGPFNCTVEALGSNGADFTGLLPLIVRELRLMGVVPHDAQLRSSFLSIIPNGFPATTHDFMAVNARQATLAEQHLRNAALLGRARCPPFFTTDVLIEVHRHLSSHGIP